MRLVEKALNKQHYFVKKILPAYVHVVEISEMFVWFSEMVKLGLFVCGLEHLLFLYRILSYTILTNSVAILKVQKELLEMTKCNIKNLNFS